MTSSDPDRGGRRHRRPRRPRRARSHHGTPTQQSDDLGHGAAQPPPPRPAQFSRDAQRRLQAARVWIAANRPYYSKAVFSCAVIAVAAPGVGIDERWRIYASSEHLEALSVERVAAELIHALNHLLRDHTQRARNTGVDATTSPLWNAAADCEINDDLHEDGLIEQDGWLLPEMLDMDEFRPAEHYFRHLLDNAVPVEMSTGCGSGCHGHHVAHELPDADDALSDFDRELLKRSVASAISEHRKIHGTGSVPAGLARWAQQTLRPKVNWRQQLAAALRTSVHHKTGTADYSWQRPSRRQQPQDPVLRPAMIRPHPSITVVVDTSGSMSTDELDRALTEISAIIATVVAGDSVRVLSVDTDVHTDQHIHNTNQINLQGAGGTDMATGITTAAETNPDAIVVITDGWTPWPQTRPTGARSVIAALTNDRYRELDNVPDWIQTIDMSEHPAT